MEGLAINVLLVQLYQLELLTTGLAAKVTSGKGFSADSTDTGPGKPQGPIRRVPCRKRQSHLSPAPLAPRPLAHRAAWR